MLIENTIKFMESLSDDQKTGILREAKPYSFESSWCPYCLDCSTGARMTRKTYGFVCEGKGDWWARKGCGNMIGFNLHRLKESPLNK